MSGPAAVCFVAGAGVAVELGAADIPELQAFFEANPLYFEVVNGEPPGPGEALEEFESRPPEGWDYTRKWFLGFRDGGGALIGMADIIEDLLAPRVWHVGTFLVATALHGSGAAHGLYGALEGWMRAGGAEWARLGVVVDNPRGGRFWERAGYVELRRREPVIMKARTHVVRVMAKPLAGGSLTEYLSLVPRDRRPEA